jgi:hypothetical protein
MYMSWEAKHRLLRLLLRKTHGIQRKQQAIDMEAQTDVENDFRQRYSAELRKMTDKRLLDERIQVKQQGMRTPQRRGELVKHEEIDRELVRRDILKGKAKGSA